VTAFVCFVSFVDLRVSAAGAVDTIAARQRLPPMSV
jgi:hypothetical protein